MRKFVKITSTILLSISVIILLIDSCKPKQPEPKLGRYVFIDMLNCVHIDRDCCVSNNKGKDIKNVSNATFIDTANFNGKVYSSKGSNYMIDCDICVKCVSDKDYTHLLEIIERNKKLPKAY